MSFSKRSKQFKVRRKSVKKVVDADLLATALEAHEHRRHTALTVHQPHLLPQLRELEEAFLVQLDPLLQDAQQHLQRRVLQRRLHHIQQGLVLNQPLLNLVSLQGELALMALRDGRLAARSAHLTASLAMLATRHQGQRLQPVVMALRRHLVSYTVE